MPDWLHPKSMTVLTILCLLAVLIVAFRIIAWIRSSFVHDQPDTPATSAGFSLGEARSLRSKGLITEQEFERIKSRILIAASTLPPEPPPRKTGGFPIITDPDDPHGPPKKPLR